MSNRILYSSGRSIVLALDANLSPDAGGRLLSIVDADTLQVNADAFLRVGDQVLIFDEDTEIDFDDLDTGARENGKDYFVYACLPLTGDTPVLKISLASTYPDGYDADTSRKIGGFHTLCAAVGTIAGHSLTGYAAGSILPASLWDLFHKPACSDPRGMAYSAEANIWADIYLQSGTGTSTLSANGGTITDNRTWMDHVDDLAAVGKRLLDDGEFQIVAAGSNEETNIAGSTDPVTTGGHSDTAGRRMVSNIGLEDCCGAMYQWLRDNGYRFDADVAPTWTVAGKTVTVTHAASPGGNPIYLKYGTGGFPYLCCNMATDAVDKFVTFSSAYTVRIKHDADAATGGYQVYFDEDATQPGRLLCALPGLKDEYLRSSNPATFLKIAYNATPATPGVALYFDDGADERLEFTSPTAANGTIDLAYISSPAFAWYDLGSKGSLYRQGAYGDVKLHAGGDWNDGSACGSRCRRAYSYRWLALTFLGGRGRSEHRRLT